MRPRIYANVPHQTNATVFYRVFTPITRMHDLGLAEAALDWGGMELSPEQRLFAAQTADVLHFRGNHGVGLDIALRNHRKKAWYKLGDKWRLYPISVMDLDDDMWRVQPFNAAFNTLGICVETKDSMYWLRPGDKVEQIEGGEKVTIWEDGKNGLNIAENILRMRHMALNAGAADLVTVTTPKLAEAVKREVPNVEPFIYPNCIDPKDYDLDVDLGEHPDEIRILWQGSPTHLECWEELIPAITRLAEKYPKTVWYFWGGEWRLPIWQRITASLPQDRVRLLPWRPYEEYKVRLACINHDINLAPLYKSTFNNSRSAIKWYESSVLRRPVPTLAERWGAYELEMTDGVNGLLYDTPAEFEQKLSLLIEDADLRKRLAESAKAWVIENRNPDDWARKLHVKITEIIEERSKTPKPEEPNEPVSEVHTDVREGEGEGSPPSEQVAHD